MRETLAFLTLALLACSSDDSTPEPSASIAFAGIRAVAPSDENTLRVSWAPADGSFRYRVYASIHAGRAADNPPVLTTEPGATSAYIKVGPPGSRQFVTVRVVDAAGHVDANRIEKSAVPASDTHAPTFAGLKNLDGVDGGGVKLSWDEAQDDLTPPEAIRYFVFSGPGLVDYTKPLAVVEGAKEVTVPNAIKDGETKRFAVLAMDAANNRESNTVTILHSLNAAPLGPTFAGCASVVAHGSHGVTVSWAAATDETTPASKIAYDVWIATSSGAQTLGATPNATVTGALTVNVDNLNPATQYFVVCRARDEANNRDTNKVEKSATTSDDATPPTFAGIDTMSFDETNRTLNLTWLAATDDRTAQNQIVYDVYQRVNGANFDFTKPPLITSAAGATSIDISGLPSNATLGWVVRARDEALNDDNNVVQVNGTTLVSYALDIQPIFSKNCAVVGCHVSGNPTGGMSLSSAVSYGNIVNVTSSYMGLKRIDPTTPIDTSASYILRKTQTVSAPFNGNPMPAPGTGNSLTDDDKTKLLLWVQQKAPNN